MIVELFLSVVIPLGLDLYLPAPASNPITAEKIELGRRLFNDRRLSRDGSIACSSCHDPQRAFANSRTVSVGIDGRAGRRNVPAIVNRGYGRAFFWDGRTTTLEEQVLRPITAPDEMDADVTLAAARVGLSVEELSHALASYVRSLLSGNSAFDRFANGDVDALTPQQKLGLRVFRGKGRCTSCHAGPTFTDERFHNTGVAWNPDEQRILDDGRFLVTGTDSDRGAFKTPTLRDVARTAPYMHDGSVATLADAIEFYDGGGRPNPNLDVDVRPLRLNEAERAALVAFLEALSGTTFDDDALTPTRRSEPDSPAR